MRFATSFLVLSMLIGFKCMASDSLPATRARVDVYYGKPNMAYEALFMSMCCLEPLRLLYSQAFPKQHSQDKKFDDTNNDTESTFQAETLSEAQALSPFYGVSTMLQTLKLVEHANYQGDPSLTAWLPFFKSIQFLDTLHLQYDLSSAYLTYLTENLAIKNLRTLSFDGASLENWDAAGVNALFGFISRFTNVETLDLSILTYDEPLLNLGQLPEFPNLLSLTISAEQVYSDGYLYAVAQFLTKTPKLQSLQIKNGFQFTFGAMQAVTATLRDHCPDMRAFVVELGPNSSIAILTQALRGCPQITKLHVKGSAALAPDAAFDLFIEQLEKSKVEDIKFDMFKAAPGDTYNKRVVAFFNTLAKIGYVKSVDVAFTIVTPGNEHSASPEALAMSNFVQGFGGSSLVSMSLGYTKMNATDGEALAKSCESRTLPLLLNWQTDVFGNVVLPAFADLIENKKVILNGTYRPHL